MKKLLALLFAFSLPAWGGVITNTYTFTDFSLNPINVRRATQTPIAPQADYNGAILVPIPSSQVTGGAGSVTFTNTIAGYNYRIQIDTPYGSTVRTCGYPASLTGNVNGATYLGDMKGSTFYYLYPTGAVSRITSSDGSIAVTGGGVGIVDLSAGTNVGGGGIPALTATNAAITVAGWSNSVYQSEFTRIGLNGRQYDAVVTVSSSIGSALAAITDASYAKRYKVYVPNGTYWETFTMKSYVDVIGQSQAGVVIASGDTTNNTDTILWNGAHAMLANVTVTRNNGTPATTHYPIHIDAIGDATRPYQNQEFIVYNVTASTAGASPKSAIGCGIYGYQRLFLVDSTFTAPGSQGGVYLHNIATQSFPASMNLLNVTATGLRGLLYDNVGSGHSDQLNIVGGSFVGSGSDDVLFQNNGGAGESLYNISSNTVAARITVSAGTRQYGPAAIPAIEDHSARFGQFNGPLYTGPVGAYMLEDGTVAGSNIVAWGNLGIGITNPAFKLQVGGTAGIGGDTLIAGAATITNYLDLGAMLDLRSGIQIVDTTGIGWVPIGVRGTNGSAPELILTNVVIQGSNVSKATVSALGTVQPDGSSIVIDGNGVISSLASGGTAYAGYAGFPTNALLTNIVNGAKALTAGAAATNLTSVTNFYIQDIGTGKETAFKENADGTMTVTGDGDTFWSIGLHVASGLTADSLIGTNGVIAWWPGQFSGKAAGLTNAAGSPVISADATNTLKAWLVGNEQFGTAVGTNILGSAQVAQLTTNYFGAAVTNSLGQPVANAIQGIIQTGATTNNHVVTLAAGGTGDVVAAGNNNFTGSNYFGGATVVSNLSVTNFFVQNFYPTNFYSGKTNVGVLGTDANGLLITNDWTVQRGSATLTNVAAGSAANLWNGHVDGGNVSNAVATATTANGLAASLLWSLQFGSTTLSNLSGGLGNNLWLVHVSGGNVSNSVALADNLTAGGTINVMNGAALTNLTYAYLTNAAPVWTPVLDPNRGLLHFVSATNFTLYVTNFPTALAVYPSIVVSNSGANASTILITCNGFCVLTNGYPTSTFYATNLTAKRQQVRVDACFDPVGPMTNGIVTHLFDK